MKTYFFLLITIFTTQTNAVTILPRYDPGGDIGRSFGSGISEGLSIYNARQIQNQIEQINQRIASNAEMEKKTANLFRKILLEVEVSEVERIFLDEMKKKCSESELMPLIDKFNTENKQIESMTNDCCKIANFYSLSLSLFAQNALHTNKSETPYFQINEKKIIKEVKKLAENGCSTAQLYLAVYFNDKQKLTSSTYWTLQAAEKGVAVAMYGLAASYASGQGILPNLPESAKWYMLSARFGHPIAKEIINKSKTFGISESIWYQMGQKNSREWLKNYQS